ncbi:PQQ-binding-like beta-propeller repeat protein [Patulibacter sp.]|uniref:outer membrane protein assembly factor BamB family protein n=1 Tax=Patulibacter sp. TaxID=1912859 RepID=UPI002716FAD3|nr:PQQ-binding-like beta-propeller repeat protein [Patulibacter sp.]MDO9410535.1 PQQ-like beta-propeller repeat protein [Patulibacter sp.]
MAGSSSDPRRRRLRIGGALLALLVVLGAAAAFVVTRGPDEVSDPSVEFAGGQESGTTTQRAPEDAEDRYDDGADWPVYGGNPQRTRYLPFAGPEPVRPPFTERWGVTGKVLLEFPPVLCGRRIYSLRNDGVLRAVERRTGKVAWTKRIGSLAASAPACGAGRVYATVLRRNRFVKGGEAVALRSTNGHRVWRVRLAGRTESSPLLTPDRMIFGTEDGDVLALQRSSGRVMWRYRAGAPVKAAVALDGDALYVGDYAGTMHSIWLRTGRRRWTTDLGGRLYSTPAVAYGRVFVGNVDGSVAAVGERSGRLAWRRRTKGFVYSAPAVAPVAGRGPTVFVGSYGGNLYAYDARTGRSRWTKSLGGRVSGGITVVGDLVMYANLGRRTLGIRRAADGALLYSHRSGAFDPGISDGRRLYIDTYTSVYHLVPGRQVRRDDESFRTAARRRGTG